MLISKNKLDYLTLSDNSDILLTKGIRHDTENVLQIPPGKDWDRSNTASHCESGLQITPSL